MIRIISKKQSPRLSYIASYLSSRLGICIEIVQKKIEENPSDHINISYDEHQTSSCNFHIPSSGLLFRTGIDIQLQPDCTRKNDLPYLFPMESNGNISFDLFSGIFYCLTRYEEYGHIEKDEHGRFRGMSSHSANHNYIDIPLVDIYVSLFKKIITQHRSGINFPIDQYNIQPTIDIDDAYAFINKSTTRTILSSAKNIIKGQGSILKNKQKVFVNETNDPYDTFEYLKSHLENDDLLKPIFFILMSTESKFDSSNTLDSDRFLDLLKDLKKKYEIGIHPSYTSDQNSTAISTEKLKLESFLNLNIHQSRQHYLKLSFPNTYRQLIQEGITKDYSMGYHDLIGFRAGTCFPFYWYDLEKENETELKIFPFQVMDVTLKQYMNLSPNEAIKSVHHIKQSIKEQDGTFQFIWHNSSFYEQEGWAGWKVVFQNIIVKD